MLEHLQQQFTALVAGGAFERVRRHVTPVEQDDRMAEAHLKPDLFSTKDLAVLDLDLAGGDAVPVQLGQSLGRTAPSAGSK